jgi:sugar phosphate isomerase/epimerase
MRRRSFLAGAGAIAVPLLATSGARAAAAGEGEIPARKLERLAISSSTYRANYDGRQSVPSAMPRLSHLTFPGYVREQFGIRKVELWDQQFGPEGHTEEQCRLVRAAADAAGVSIVSVEVEDMPRLDQTDPAAHADAIAQLKAWLDKGRILGCTSMRFNVTRGRDPANVDAAIDTLRQGARYGRSVGVRVLLENHGGYTASIPDMISLVRAVNDDFCRIEIDWGAWKPPGDRYEALQSAMPYVQIVSAKGELFDEATYQHTSYDVGRIVRNAEAGGYRGVYSIELYNNPAPKDTDRAVRSFMKVITDNMR